MKRAGEGSVCGEHCQHGLSGGSHLDRLTLAWKQESPFSLDGFVVTCKIDLRSQDWNAKNFLFQKKKRGGGERIKKATLPSFKTMIQLLKRLENSKSTLSLQLFPKCLL